MFNRFIAITLIVALVGANLSRFFVYAEFSVNQKYITDNFCVNKNRPWLHCNGHCFFMKKVKQAEENEKKQAAKDNLNRLAVSYFQQPYRIIFSSPLSFTAVHIHLPAYTYQYSNSYIEAIFRPPKSLV
ncbi:MAG: hypothetical protein ACRYFL_15715 [Janthinobacterium lividum]